MPSSLRKRKAGSLATGGFTGQDRRSQGKEPGALQKLLE